MSDSSVWGWLCTVSSLGYFTEIQTSCWIVCFDIKSHGGSEHFPCYTGALRVTGSAHIFDR